MTSIQLFYEKVDHGSNHHRMDSVFSMVLTPHDLSEANRRERVLKANLLLGELRADEGNEFVKTMTGNESWFFLSYESDSMFAHT
jgi:hypothetical protein